MALGRGLGSGAMRLGIPALTIASIVMASPAAFAVVLSNWSFDPTAQQLAITLPKGITPRFLVFAEPTRIVLEVPNTQMGPMVTKQSYFGAVQAVEVVQHTADTIHISLVLAPGTVIDRRHAELTATDAGGQTQWTLTPLLAGNTPSIAEAPQEPVNLPILPAIPTPPVAPLDEPPAEQVQASPVEQVQAPPVEQVQVSPNPRFVETPEGQLSIAASNLMLPPASDRLAQLPDTLSLDPFSTSFAPSDQVSVPSLEETVTTASNPSSVSVPGLDVMPVAPLETASANAASSQMAAPDLPETELSETEAVANASVPPFLAPTEGAIASQSQPVDLAVMPPAATPVLPSNPVPATAEGAINVEPPALTIAEANVPSVEASPIETPPVEAPSVEAPPVEASFVEAPLEAASTPPTLAPPESTQAAVDPPFLDMPASASPEAFPEPGIANLPTPALPALSSIAFDQEPPFLESVSPTGVQPPVPDPALVTMPPIATLPPAVGIPSASPPESSLPSKPAEPVPFLASAPPVRPPTRAAAEDTISFGQPLPAGAKEDAPAFPYIAQPARTQSGLDPEVLIPQGTLLKLRYPGAQSLRLDQRSALDATLLLEADLVDARTGAVIVPAGSQMVGQFKPDERGQRWVGEALLLPGRQVALSGASAYFAGPPQVSGQNLALGSGIGALALTVLTGFTGVGLLGGAALGAATAVGVTPQAIVVEPNQIIEVQILEDVPRSSLQL